MDITLKGHTLNQRQLDAITPVLNELIGGKVSQKGFDDACVQALEKAGCPLGYDTGICHDQTLVQRAENWKRNGMVGSSSLFIWEHMQGADASARVVLFAGYPHDGADLNRCLLLLDLIPEWAPRMPELAQYGGAWAAIAPRWSELSSCFLEEAGLNWCKSDSAPKTYQLMKSIIAGATA